MFSTYDRPGHSFLPRAFPLDLSPDPASCSLLGPTAIVVQLLMGALVLLSLLYKRQLERPKRAWWIWAFDVGKQVVGQASVHVSNVVISWIGASNGGEGNACAWYLVNILVDTTIGVGLIYIALHGLTLLLSDRLQLPGLISGEYGHPPRWSFFFRQLVVYLLALAFMKLVVLGLFYLVPEALRVGDWLLEWTADNWALQVVVVMGAVPITMNILQFWLIDSIVKSKMLPFTSAGSAVPAQGGMDDPTDERDPLMLEDGELPPGEEYEPEDGRLTGKRILDDLEAQRGNGTSEPGLGKQGKNRSPPPSNDRRSSTGTVESYHLRPMSRENSSSAGGLGSGLGAGPSGRGFRVPTLHVTKPSADWEWNAQDEWGEDPFDDSHQARALDESQAQGQSQAQAGEGRARGNGNGNAVGGRGKGAVLQEEEEHEDPEGEDAWGSMEALDGPKATR